jgi:hypothetical protein
MQWRLRQCLRSRIGTSWHQVHRTHCQQLRQQHIEQARGTTLL